VLAGPTLPYISRAIRISGVAITLAARATLGGPAVQGGPVPPMLGHFVECNYMGCKIEYIRHLNSFYEL